MSRINLTPERIPNGRYPLRIVKVCAVTSRSGHPTLRINFEVLEDPFAGHSITCFYSLLPQARFRLRRLLHAAGLPPPQSELETSDLLNASVFAIVRSRSFASGPPVYDIEDEVPLSPF